MQSSPGGRGMGLPYAQYLQISQAMQYINPVLADLGCLNKHSQLACLEGLSADALATGSDKLELDGVNQAFLVQDGLLLSKDTLDYGDTVSLHLYSHQLPRVDLRGCWRLLPKQFPASTPAAHSTHLNAPDLRPNSCEC